MGKTTTTVMRFEPATLDNVPLLIGLQGPPGGGKTYSALLLAKGIQVARPGPIRVIDTEGGRARKYSEEFEFETLELDAPRSDALQDALFAAITQDERPSCIIIDTVSEEHEELLEWHDQEIDKLLDDHERQVQKQRDRVGMSAWRRPKGARRSLLKFLRKVRVPLIMTFRAEEKTKPIKTQVENRNGDTREVAVPTPLGYQPIAPAQIIHMMDLMCLLPLRAEGLPTWVTGNEYESFALKLPEFFKPLFAKPAKISPAQGTAMAVWALGQTAEQRELLAEAQSKACDGYEPFAAWWRSIPIEKRGLLARERDALVDCARKVDAGAHKAELTQ